MKKDPCYLFFYFFNPIFTPIWGEVLSGYKGTKKQIKLLQKNHTFSQFFLLPLECF